MYYVDNVQIKVKAGNGGNGAIAFAHYSKNFNGGPTGGDGGQGGNVVIQADAQLNNLSDFLYKKIFYAENGAKGESNNKHGRKGKDVVIKVPLGTIVSNENKDIICDICDKNDSYIICVGGKGGHGNATYKNSKRQAPNFAQSGEIKNEQILNLELKTIADVGIIGLPNAGKSTLLSKLTNAKPKIANYAFTTLYPNIGVCMVDNNYIFIADMPGLIEGASDGVGLGHEFLRHIERTKLLIHVLDASVDYDSLIDNYIKINKELKKYSEKVYNLSQIILLNKIDLCVDHTHIDNFIKYIKQNNCNIKNIIMCSAKDNINLEKVKQMIYNSFCIINKKYVKDKELEDNKNNKIEKNYINTVSTNYNIIKQSENKYIIIGDLTSIIKKNINVNDQNSLLYLQKFLKKIGIDKQLQKLGIKDNDIIVINDVEFEYYK